MQMQRVVAAIPRTACEQLRHAPHTFACNLPPDHRFSATSPAPIHGSSATVAQAIANMQATVQSMKPEAMLADPAAVDALTIAHKMLVSAALTNPVIPQQAGQLLPAQQPLTAAYDLPTIGRNFDSGPARYEPDNRLWACGYFGRAPTHGVRSTGTGRPRGRAPKGMEWSAELRQWVRPESGEGGEPAAAAAITGKRGLPVELAVFAALALAGARGAGAADVPRSGGGPTCGAASRNASATSGHVAASSASQFGET